MPVAGQRTHGTTFRALKVTSLVATTGAVSAVYDCLVRDVILTCVCHQMMLIAVVVVFLICQMPQALQHVYVAYLGTDIIQKVEFTSTIIISFQSPTHSFIPGLKLSFSADPSHRSLSFSSSGFTTWIPQTVYCYF